MVRDEKKENLLERIRSTAFILLELEKYVQEDNEASALEALGRLREENIQVRKEVLRLKSGRNILIEELPLSTRARNTLFRMLRPSPFERREPSTVSDLLNLEVKAILEQRNLGKNSFLEIINALKAEEILSQEVDAEKLFRLKPDISLYEAALDSIPSSRA